MTGKLCDDALQALASELEALDRSATEAPWAWDQRGEKVNEWGMGVAFTKDEKPIVGYFKDEDAIYVEQVCSTEGATLNYNDPKLICALRNNLSAIIEALRAAPPSSEPVAHPKLLESAAAMMEYGRCIATDDDAASKFAYFRDQLRLAASPQPTSKEPK